jgi:hypothetical protein
MNFKISTQQVRHTAYKDNTDMLQSPASRKQGLHKSWSMFYVWCCHTKKHFTHHQLHVSNSTAYGRTWIAEVMVR